MSTLAPVVKRPVKNLKEPFLPATPETYQDLPRLNAVFRHLLGSQAAAEMHCFSVYDMFREKTEFSNPGDMGPSICLMSQAIETHDEAGCLHTFAIMLQLHPTLEMFATLLDNGALDAILLKTAKSDELLDALVAIRDIAYVARLNPSDSGAREIVEGVKEKFPCFVVHADLALKQL